MRRVYAGFFLSNMIAILSLCAHDSHISGITFRDVFPCTSPMAYKACIGGIASVCDVVCNYPLYSIKNLRQDGKTWAEIFSKEVRLYRGAGINAVRCVPVTALQLCTHEQLKKIIPGHDAVSSAMRAFAAGAACTLYAGPLESLIVHCRYNPEKKIHQAVIDMYALGGCRSFARGFVSKCIRSGMFSVGLIGLYPQLKATVLQMTQKDSVATVGSALAAGAATVLLTHPFDTIANRMQKDCAAKEFPTTCKTAHKLYATGGVSSLYKGLVPRSLLVASAFCIMNSVMEVFHTRLPERVVGA